MRTILTQKIVAVHPFALECRANPVVDWSRHQADHLRGLRPFAKRKHGFGASALSRRRQTL